MTRAADLLASNVGAATAVWLLVIGYLLVGYLTLSPDHAWGDDWAQYVNHARNLATGRAYADTGYIFNPAAPHVGPPTYSPGLPLLLAPIFKIWGLNIIALKSVSLVCMAAAIGIAFMLYRHTLGAGVSAVAAFLFGLHASSWSLRNFIVSEPPYILWSLLSLYFASRFVRDRGFVSAVLCGFFAYAAFATRPVGITLVIAVLAHQVAQQGFGNWRIWLLAVVPAAGITLQRHFIPLADYSAELHVPTLWELLGNIVGYWKATATLFPLGGPVTLFSPLVFAGLALLGIAYRLRSADGEPRSHDGHRHEIHVLPRLWTLLARIPVDIWYLGLYLGALVALPFQTNARYLVPVLPLMYAYGVYAISRALASAPYRRVATFALFTACICYYAALYWSHRGISSRDDALCEDCRRMYSFIRNNTAPEARIAFVKPRVLALLTDRHAWVWASNSDARSTWAELESTHISYIVLVTPDNPLAPRYPAQFGWGAWRSNPQLTLVFENTSFRVLRVRYKQ